MNLLGQHPARQGALARHCRVRRSPCPPPEASRASSSRTSRHPILRPSAKKARRNAQIEVEKHCLALLGHAASKAGNVVVGRSSPSNVLTRQGAPGWQPATTHCSRMRRGAGSLAMTSSGNGRTPRRTRPSYSGKMVVNGRSNVECRLWWTVVSQHRWPDESPHFA
jgi:hypothetical protein